MAAIHLRNSDADIHIAGIRQGTDDSDLGFFFEGTERVRFSKLGVVTIGTLTSGQTGQLVVNTEGGVPPVAKFMSRTNKAIVQVSDNDTTGYISSENGLFSLGRNPGVNANNINIDSSNRVGIGASNVQEKLHVYNAGTARIEVEGTTGPAAFKATNNQGSFGWYIPSDANNFRLWNFGTSADLVTVDASGNTTFAGKITTAGGVNYTGGTIAVATTVLHTNDIVYNIGGNNGIILSNYDYSERYYITNADHRWEVGSADAMRLTSTGLGIGVTNPENKLHILTSTTDTTQQLLIQNGSTGDAAIKFNISGDTYSFGIDNSDSDKFKLSAGNLGTNDRITVDSSGLVGIGTSSPTYKLSVSGGIEAGGKITYSKSYGSLNATGNAVAGITASANGNGSSCGFTFTCFGGTGKYQKIVYSCYNGSGTWYAKKVIDEGTNDLDVAASADGSTITFTFKATSSSQSYTPRVTVEATGHNINSTYA